MRERERFNSSNGLTTPLPITHEPLSTQREREREGKRESEGSNRRRKVYRVKKRESERTTYPKLYDITVTPNTHTHLSLQYQHADTSSEDSVST